MEEIERGKNRQAETLTKFQILYRYPHPKKWAGTSLEGRAHQWKNVMGRNSDELRPRDRAVLGDKVDMKRFGTKWFLAAAIPVFATAAFANQVSVAFTGVGDGALVGYAYLDPYTATVGGTTNLLVLCDDWSNNTYSGEKWTANAINLSTLYTGAGSAPMFGSISTPADALQTQHLYNELAWLGSKLVQNPTDHTTQAEVSFAMWIMTYGLNGTSMETPDPTTYLSTYDPAIAGPTGAVQNLITEAGTHSNYDGTGWEILTPIDGTSNMGSTPQEFLTYTGNVPEPSAFGVLATAMAGLFWFRKRRAAVR